MKGFRYVFAMFGCFSMAIIYGFKCCMTLALVNMVNNTALALKRNETLTHKKAHEGPFEWDTTAQQLILLSYFIGYFVSQIPGGMISDTFGAKWIMAFALSINVVCFLLTPVFARIHYGMVVLMRICEGIGGGVSFPAAHHMLTLWVPNQEKSLLINLVYAGTSLGVMFTNIMTGIIIKSLSWEFVFYIFGTFGLLVTIGWMILITDSPESEPSYLVSQAEKDYIVKSTGGSHKHPPVPILKVFSSCAFLAILGAHTCGNSPWYLFIIELPLFISKVLDVDDLQNSIHASLPYFFLWLFCTIFGTFLDKLIEKNKITVATARKISTGVCAVVPFISLIIICVVGKKQKAIVITCLYFSIVACGGQFSGYLCNHIDIAPTYAAGLIGITNTCATIPGILMPLIIKFATEKHETDFDGWRIVFFVTMGFLFCEFIIFTFFAKGEIQPWDPKYHEETEEEDNEGETEEEAAPAE